MTNTILCACGSERELSHCCLPVIHGQREALTAEELLRARYTAFTLGEMSFISSSHHSRTREEVNQEENEDWAKKSKWLGLNILQKEAGEKGDERGTIIFSAQYQVNGKTYNHSEKSLFEKENGKWRFLDAQPAKSGPVRRTDPKVGRNDSCPCGSGKKYKKCCG